MRLDPVRVLFLALALALLGPTLVVAASPPEEPETIERRDELHLKSGDVLRGSLVSAEHGILTFDHPELGRLHIPIDRVVSYGPAPTPKASAATGAKPPPSAFDAALNPPKAPTAGPSVKPLAEGTLPPIATDPAADAARDEGWKVNLGFALAGNFAINDEVTLRASIGARRETARDTTTLEAEYYYRLFNSDVTDNNVLAKALQEWNFGTSPWLFFIQGQYQYDEFQPWTHRVSMYVGPGYRVVHDETMDLTFRLGGGATYENGDVDEVEPELLLAEDWTWRISRRQALTLNTSIAPNVQDFADYRIQSQIEYRFLLDETKRGLSLTAGLRDIFLSKPAPDAKSNELRVYAGLRYDF